MNSGVKRVIDYRDKSFPGSAAGLTIEDFLHTQPSIEHFSTPLLTLDASDLQNNIAVMAQWVAHHGFELMPHGKTTMAPQLWRQQLDAGATGITVATPWQARVALTAGVPTVMLANECVDPPGLHWIVDYLNAHPEQSFICWADSLDAVACLDAIVAATPANQPVGVLVELGVPGGRTGARTIAAAVDVAQRICASPRLALRGVAGYEGAVGHDRSLTSMGRIHRYLDDMKSLFEVIRGRVDDSAPIVSAGGSAFFDAVAQVFASLGDGTARVVLRSGAYLTHDSGFYESISPLGARLHPSEPHLRPASWGYARVLSCPDPGLALLDGGKRDFPFDEGLPTAVGQRASLGAPEQPFTGQVVSTNDQHSYLHFEGESPRISSVVRLGLSHPCTMFDKWRLIPVIESESGTVVDVVETFF